MKRDLYVEVANRIVAQLETGCAPWVKPWSKTAGANVPQNAVTGRPYSGVNVVLLWQVSGFYPTMRFLTFKQAKAAGGSVRKGEHGFKVYFVKRLQDKKDPDRTFSMLREFTVFNVAQCDGLPEKLTQAAAAKVRNNDMRDATIDDFVAATGATIHEGAGEAYFAPGGDFISMPAFAAFKGAAQFYATEFHELAHWTGAKSRLGRDFSGRFGTKAYAAEELVAELTAAFICAEFDIDGDLRHAGYIANWITLLKDDPKAIFTAASKAQEAANYLRGLALADDGDAGGDAANDNDDALPLAA